MRARLCLPWVLLRTGEGLLLRDCSCAGGSRRPGPAAKAGGTSDDCGCLRSTSASPGALLPTAELIDKPAQELEKIDAQAREKTEKLALELKTVQAQEEEKQEQRTLDLKKLEQQEVQENLAEEEESSEGRSNSFTEKRHSSRSRLVKMLFCGGRHDHSRSCRENNAIHPIAFCPREDT